MGTASTNPTAAALAHLAAAGYSDEFRAEPGGLRAIHSGELFAPEELVIEQLVRAEISTALDESSIVFALRCPRTGTAGTYCVPYGPEMALFDARVVERLGTAAPSARGPH